MIKVSFVPFHGFRVPLLGLAESETLNECADCHDRFDLLQIRLNQDGRFRCDTCTARNDKYLTEHALPDQVSDKGQAGAVCPAGSKISGVSFPPPPSPIRGVH